MIEQMRAMESTRRKLEAFEEKGSEEADVIKSSSSEVVHQKLED